MILTSKDFTIIDGELALINRHGFSLVFFTAPQCVYCDEFKPYFEYVSKTVKGCNFYFCDINEEIGLKQATSYTKTPITYVPFVLLFAYGKKEKQFFPDEENPDNNVKLLVNFLQDTISRHNANTPQTVESPYGGIPYNTNPARSKTKICKLTDMYTKMTYPN